MANVPITSLPTASAPSADDYLILQGTSTKKIKWSALLNKIYPVGSLYMSAKATSPASLFGGTWERIKDRFILAAGDTYAAGSTGGEASVALSLENIPSFEAAIYVNGNPSYPIGCWDDGNRFHGFKASVAGAGFIGDMEQDIRARYINNAVKPISTVPPYTTVCVWKRIA